MAVECSGVISLAVEQVWRVSEYYIITTTTTGNSFICPYPLSTELG